MSDGTAWSESDAAADGDFSAAEEESDDDDVEVHFGVFWFIISPVSDARRGAAAVAGETLPLRSLSGPGNAGGETEDDSTSREPAAVDASIREATSAAAVDGDGGGGSGRLLSMDAERRRGRRRKQRR